MPCARLLVSVWANRSTAVHWLWRARSAERHMSSEERHCLEEADRKLIQQAKRFYRQLSEVADIAALRERSGALPSHWWWYLDVLAAEPVAAA